MGRVAPNPMVGAVLVHDGRIIGEGWHQQYGGPHAEPNCLASVKEVDRNLISQSILYVSLEPCAHFGKTPPCADLIIANKIPKVVIGCSDPFTKVDGKGIGKLRAAGIEVTLHVLELEAKDLNKRFFTFHTKLRPYIILKWAETGNGKMAASLNSSQRLLISNDYSNRLVHRWRSEEAAIMIGTNTALKDDPELTTRLYEGPSPIRLVVDMNLRLPAALKIYNREVRTIIFNSIRHEEIDNLTYYRLTPDESLVQQIANALYLLNIQSVLVEGGAKLLQSCIDENLWDEIRVIKNESLIVTEGLAAPQIRNATKRKELEISGDKIMLFTSEAFIQNPIAIGSTFNIQN